MTFWPLFAQQQGGADKTMTESSLPIRSQLHSQHSIAGSFSIEDVRREIRLHLLSEKRPSLYLRQKKCDVEWFCLSGQLLKVFAVESWNRRTIGNIRMAGSKEMMRSTEPHRAVDSIG